MRRRKLIAGVTLVCLIGAAVYNYSVRPLYEGMAVVSAGETVPGQPFLRLPSDTAHLAIVAEKEIARITSVDLSSAIIDQLGPPAKAELATGPLGPWYQRLRFRSSPEVQAAAQLNRAESVAALRSRLRLRWRERSSWIEVRVVGYDPEAAAEIANAMVIRYVAETVEANRQVIEKSKNAVSSQVETKEKQLGEQLTGLRELGAETGLGDFAGRKAILERQIRAFQDALVAAQTARVGRAATGREAAHLDGGGPVAGTDTRIQTAQNRVSELEDRERVLLATLGALHPDVLTVQAQLKGARERLETALQSIEKNADSAYQLAVKEEARIQANLLKVQEELASLDKESFEYTMTQKKADASRISIEQMMMRQENQAPIIIQTEIISTALPPLLPSSPQKRDNFSYALLGGLLLGILLATILERFDDTIQSPDDIREILGLPFLGVVPMVAKLPLSSMMAAIIDSRTGFADGLRVVRTSIIYGAAPRRPKVLVFTSASPGDGKSTVASGVAILMHETGARVLLIDGDLRRPSIHLLLSVPSNPGLSDLLATTPPVTLRVSRGPVNGVDVVSSGPPLTVSAALLGSENMRSLIEQARELYDWVIIDSPPSLGLPDASVLSTLADAVVVVCSGDKTPRQALRSVSNQLSAVGASVIGVVLNRVDMARHSYYYGRYYSAYYGLEAKTPASPQKVALPAQASRT